MRKPKPAISSLLDRRTIKSLRLADHFVSLLFGDARVVHVQLHDTHDTGMNGAVHASGHRDSVLDGEGAFEIDLLEENARVLHEPALFIHWQAGCGIEPQLAFEQTH